MFKIMKNILSIIASIFLLGSITAKADVVVASAGPMSGQYASFGAQLKAGAETVSYTHLTLPTKRIV